MGFTFPHGIEGFLEDVIEGPAEHFGALFDDFAGAACGEAFGFIFFLEGFEFHVLDAFGGAHEGGGADQAGEFIGGEEDFFHGMFRLDIDVHTVGVATDGVDHFFTDARLAEEFGGFDAVFFGVHFEVDVVEQADHAPEVFFVGIAELACVPAHDAFDGQGVVDMEGVLIIFFQVTALISVLVLMR